MKVWFENIKYSEFKIKIRIAELMSFWPLDLLVRNVNHIYSSTLCIGCFLRWIFNHQRQKIIVFGTMWLKLWGFDHLSLSLSSATVFCEIFYIPGVLLVYTF